MFFRDYKIEIRDDGLCCHIDLPEIEKNPYVFYYCTACSSEAPSNASRNELFRVRVRVRGC